MPELKPVMAPSEELLAKNRQKIIDRLASGCHEGNHGDRCMLGLELERFVYDPASRMTISYDGIGSMPGVGDLLESMAKYWEPEERVIIDGHLAGFSGTFHVDAGDVGVSVSIEPSAQLEVSVGPSTSVTVFFQAIEHFDRQVQLAIRDLGMDWQLLAQGSNPTVSSPEDLPLIPKERYRLMDAYLSKTGRYARDMMRASCATQVSIDYGSEQDMVDCMRLVIAMGPLLSFGCDNTVRWRGSRPSDTPRMARSRVWSEMDPARCGTPPHLFEPGYGFATYAEWIADTKPILFTAEDGITYDTGGLTNRDIMLTRDLTDNEVSHIFTMMFPNARVKGYLEIREADSLPPRMAAGFTAFIKGLFCNEDVFKRACALFEGIGAEDVDAARTELQDKGWDAICYGRNVGEILDDLTALASEGLNGDEDARFLGELCDLWLARMVPRDLARLAPSHLA